MSTHYTDGRRWSHISNAWILVEGWNDKEEIASLRAQLESRKGWKMVPVEPTEEMLRAAVSKDDAEFYGDAMVLEEVARDYAAMLAAAPHAAITSESATQVKAARFENVSCSQCGRDFGPGEHGFSHCRNHAEKAEQRSGRLMHAMNYQAKS